MDKLTIKDVEFVLSGTRIIATQVKKGVRKCLSVSFDKEFVITSTGQREFRTFNKLVAIDKYNEIII